MAIGFCIFTTFALNQDETHEQASKHCFLGISFSLDGFLADCHGHRYGVHDEMGRNFHLGLAYRYSGHIYWYSGTERLEINA